MGDYRLCDAECDAMNHCHGRGREYCKECGNLFCACELDDGLCVTCEEKRKADIADEEALEEQAYIDETNNWLKGKQIMFADVSGDGVELTFGDGTVFRFDSGDGYATWNMEDRND